MCAGGARRDWAFLAGAFLAGLFLVNCPRPRVSKGVVMGQATVDLPDPLKAAAASTGPTPTPSSSLASADALLAQLAGEEIDRLLAEAGAERPALADGAVAAAPTAATNPGQSVSGSIGAPPAQLSPS